MSRFRLDRRAVRTPDRAAIQRPWRRWSQRSERPCDDDARRRDDLRERTRRALPFIELTARPDVHVAVGAQDHAVDAAGLEVARRDVVRELDAGAAVRRATRLEPPERRADRVLVVRRIEHETRGAGVDDDRDRILWPQVVDEHAQRLHEQRQLVRIVHRARGVDQKRQVARRHLRAVDLLGLQADANELVRGCPRRGVDLGGDRERIVALGPGVVVK